MKKESMICEVAAHARWITGFDISHDGLVGVIIIITIIKKKSNFSLTIMFHQNSIARFFQRQKIAS